MWTPFGTRGALIIQYPHCKATQCKCNAYKCTINTIMQQIDSCETNSNKHIIFNNKEGQHSSAEFQV